MKKNNEIGAALTIGLIVLVLAVVVLLSFSGDNMLAEPIRLPEKTEAPSSLPTPRPTEQPEPEPEPEPETELSPEEAEAAASKEVDFDAIYALHDPEEVVMTIDGREITWQDYCYAYFSQARNMEQQFVMYQYYGYALGWESQADEEGHSFAELLPLMGEENLRRIVTAEAVAEEEHIRLLPDEEASVQAEHQDNILYLCGEDGTEEQMLQMLQEERWLRPELYWRIMRFDALTQAASRSLYGNGGMRLNDRQVLAWMEEQGILSANHILLSTIDMSTYMPLDEAAAAEQAELAQQIASELQAIEDPEELEKRFLELKEQYDTDGGDYVFGPGVMVQEFYDGTLALEVGQVSDPIQTQYGYHIILRRPLHPDDTVISESGEMSARSLMAQVLFNQKMEDRMEAQVVEYAPGFEPPYILDYVTRPTA